MNRSPRCRIEYNQAGRLLLQGGGSDMISFLLGCMTGGTIGIVTMCLCRAAADADRHSRPK